MYTYQLGHKFEAWSTLEKLTPRIINANATLVRMLSFQVFKFYLKSFFFSYWKVTKVFPLSEVYDLA